jgi:hypothetical protein
MSTFEYLSVFISIVIGLAVVHILRGVVQIFIDQEAKPFWIHTGWLFYLLYFLPFFWWFTFDWRHHETWTFPVFFFVVGYAMLVYAFCVTLLPSRAERGVDFEAYFFRNHRRIFSLWAFIKIVDVADSFLKGPENVAAMPGWYLWYAVFFIGSVVVGAVTPNRRYHALLIVGWLASILVDLSAGFADVFGA